MKVAIYIAVSINGFIARADNKFHFVSKRSHRNFLKMCKEVGNCVIGRTTYEQSASSSHFPFSPGLNVVMTSKKLESKWKNVVFLDGSPEEVLKFLKNKGYNEVVIGGGGAINSSFIKAGLVTDIYIDLEPYLLGMGVKGFAEDEFEAKLQLVEAKKFSKNELLLHYKVLKN